MLKSFQRIKGLGVFADYTQPAGIAEFGVKNLIYGWNYSGKTTLSRLVAMLESKTLNPELPQCSFTISTDVGNVTETNFKSTSHVVRVFNSDFIVDNLNFAGSHFKPILLLGSESEAAQREIERCEAMYTRAADRAAEQSKEAEAATKALSVAKTATSATIKKTIGLVAAFGSTQLDAELRIVGLGLKDCTLGPDAFDADIKLAHASPKESLPAIPEMTVKMSLADLSERASTLLTKKPDLANTIAHLVDNPPVETWVQEGLHLHQGKTACEFCGGDLTAERLKSLIEHFSKDLDDHKRSIEQLAEDVTSAKLTVAERKEVEINTLFREQFVKAYGDVQQAIGVYNAELEALRTDLDSKLAAPFVVVDYKASSGKAAKAVEAALSALNTVFKSHNEVKDNFPAEKEAAINRLKQHFAHEFMVAQGLDKFKLDQARRERRRLRYESFATKLRTEIDRLKAVISQAQLGREEINKRIESLLGDESVQIAVVSTAEGERFQLVRRDGKPARHLSEGEKTAIAFSFFLTKLREIKEFDKAIVYIDDPISSLDSNHIFQVAAIIKETFFHQPVANAPWTTRCKQIFFSTHNFEFFSLLREIKPEGKNAALYLVKRVGPKTSALSNMPESMHRYDSEYHFLFHVLDDFHKSADKTDLKVLMLLPNAVRRFVELYTYSKYPDRRMSPVDTRAERVFGSEKAKRILKTLHYFSHANNIERMSENNDLMCDIEAAVGDLMEHLQSSDPEHLAALRAAVL
ncbi:AAA family ATPase [Burkholderia gladioli]|uniref:AAA family ATPase n=1 Tax=Burkholderia gladioli TaxID=28095 RepID=UPI0016415FB1|nr:AAA family ATPase [Burkholderia gladioli]